MRINFSKKILYLGFYKQQRKRTSRQRVIQKFQGVEAVDLSDSLLQSSGWVVKKVVGNIVFPGFFQLWPLPLRYPR